MDKGTQALKCEIEHLKTREDAYRYDAVMLTKKADECFQIRLNLVKALREIEKEGK